MRVIFIKAHKKSLKDSSKMYNKQRKEAHVRTITRLHERSTIHWIDETLPLIIY